MMVVNGSCRGKNTTWLNDRRVVDSLRRLVAEMGVEPFGRSKVFVSVGIRLLLVVGS